MAWLAALVSGALFSVGLAIGGMTQPSKVIGFLDVAGAWDPSLACVMGSAVATYFGLRRWIAKRPAPVFGTHFALPHRDEIDRRVLFGSAVFGVGWGLSGYCPGPAVTSLVTGLPSVFVFVGAMLIGMALHNRFMAYPRHSTPVAPQPNMRQPG